MWNADNRLTSVTTAGTSTYTYNGAGLRTSKTVGGTTKTHLTDGDTPASALLSDGSTTYVPGVSERRNSTTSFFLFDLLGSVRATSGAAGAAGEFALFEAFGNAVTTADFGGATTSGRPFGFVGGEQYQADAESGLMLLGNRYYDPGIGRFLSSDPAEDGDNFYAYCKNNPVNAVDPEGLELVYRGGSATDDNLTPRPGKDTTGPKRGLSTFDTPEKAAKTGAKYQIIDTDKLKRLKPHKDKSGHVSLRPATQKELDDWAASRGNPDKQPHPLTDETRRAIVGSGTIPKNDAPPRTPLNPKPPKLQIPPKHDQ